MFEFLQARLGLPGREGHAWPEADPPAGQCAASGPSLSQVSRCLGASLPPRPSCSSAPSAAWLWARTLGVSSGSPVWPPSSLGASSRDGGRVAAHRRPCTPTFTPRGELHVCSHTQALCMHFPGEEVCVFFWVLRFSKAFCDSKLVKYELWV